MSLIKHSNKKKNKMENIELISIHIKFLKKLEIKIVFPFLNVWIKLELVKMFNI